MFTQETFESSQDLIWKYSCMSDGIGILICWHEERPLLDRESTTNPTHMGFEPGLHQWKARQFVSCGFSMHAYLPMHRKRDVVFERKSFRWRFKTVQCKSTICWRPHELSITFFFPTWWIIRWAVLNRQLSTVTLLTFQNVGTNNQ